MTGSTLLDLVLLLVLVGYAASGWRQGVVAAVIGLVGLVAGGFLAVRFAPDLIRDHTDVDTGTPVGTLLVVGVVLLAATLGQGVALAVASPVREAIRSSRLRGLDSLLGAVAVTVAAVLVVWTVAAALRTDGPPALRAAVAQSRIVGAVDGVVPSSASVLVDEVTGALDRGGFPRVFEGLGPEPITSIGSPEPALVEDPDVVRALESVVRVQASSPRCERTQVGSGWVSSRGVVVTNAHVVAGASRVRVSVGGAGPEQDARVVAFDPDRDVAVLTVDGLGARRLPRGEALGTGDDAVVAGFPGDTGLYVGAARVRSVLDARGADIYGDPGATREIYSLRARVRQGASGGPVLDQGGRVVGMVFATSLDDSDTGYALTLDELSPVLSAAGDAAVGTGACAAH